MKLSLASLAKLSRFGLGLAGKLKADSTEQYEIPLISQLSLIERG